MYSRHLSFFSGTPQHSLAVATPRKKNPHHSVLKQRRQLPNTDASSTKHLTHILQTSMENEPGLLSFIVVNVNSCTLHLKIVLDEYNSMNTLCKMKVCNSGTGAGHNAAPMSMKSAWPNRTSLVPDGEVDRCVGLINLAD